MIRTDEEYEAAMRELEQDRAAAGEHERLLAEVGLTPDQVEAAMAPLRAMSKRLAGEIEAYERRRRSQRPQEH